MNIHRQPLEKALCASLDVLGFGHAMEVAYAAGKAEQLLYDVESALETAVERITPSSGKAIWTLNFFSDNVVIGYPCYFPGKPLMQLQHFCQLLGRYQLTMAARGFFVRGGVSFGTLANDNRIVFGDALFKAHKLESTKACNPRIIIDPDLLKMFEDGANESGWRTTFESLLMQDVDGYCFVNYLSELYDNFRNLVHVPGHGNCLVVNEQGIATHRANVEKCLTETVQNPKVWSKYFWSATYHNSFCDLNGQPNQKINDALIRPRPMNLTKV